VSRPRVTSCAVTEGENNKGSPTRFRSRLQERPQWPDVRTFHLFLGEASSFFFLQSERLGLQEAVPSTGGPPSLGSVFKGIRGYQW